MVIFESCFTSDFRTVTHIFPLNVMLAISLKQLIQLKDNISQNKKPRPNSLEQNYKIKINRKANQANANKECKEIILTSDRVDNEAFHFYIFLGHGIQSSSFLAATTKERILRLGVNCF